MKTLFPYTFSLILIGTLLVISSCKENDPTPNQPITNEANAYVNEWILDEMQTWYLWNSELPTNSDINESPDEYFSSLINKKEDRFSWIQENYQELLNSLKGITKEAGYEYVLYRDKNNNNNVIAQVLYVKPDSPAEAAGLMRGDVISAINGKQMTVSNYRSIIAEMKENHTIRYKSVNPEAETFSEEKTASLSTLEYSENPSLMHKVIQKDNRKIGYYVYNLFAGGPTSESKVYDNEVDQVFAAFKTQSITDLVLDLRYNSGGAESSANNLASLIGKGVNSTKILARREYNAEITKAIVDDPELGQEFLTSKFTNKAQNIGNQLTDGRVYVLTSSRSASASELVINALKPYMDVFIIGDTTYGKNVGSISRFKEKDTKNTWGMQPIVVKIYNSMNQSDYTRGFVPNVLHPDNSLFLFPLGDEREVLLGHAIGQITGNSTSGRVSKSGERTLIGHSLDSKRRSFNLVMDETGLPL